MTRIPLTLLAAAVATSVSLPLAAQTPRSGGAPPAQGGAATANIPEATVNKTGAALREVAQIRRDYSERAQQAPEAQRQGLAEQASRAAADAITRQGITIDEYNRVIMAAQNDPSLRERVLAAAQSR